MDLYSITSEELYMSEENFNEKYENDVEFRKAVLILNFKNNEIDFLKKTNGHMFFINFILIIALIVISFVKL